MKNDSEMVLLVGGTHDGALIERPRHPVVRMIRRFAKLGLDPRHPEFGKVETEIYNRMPLYGNNHRFEVFALDGMKEDEVMDKLIERYKKT